MSINHPTSLPKKTLLSVPSRYSQHLSSRLLNKSIVNPRTSQNVPRASSPRHGKEAGKSSFNIHDSVASIIRLETDVMDSLTEHSMRNSVSTPDLSSLGEVDIRHYPHMSTQYNFLIWTALEKLSRDALVKVSIAEKIKREVAMTKLANAKQALTNKRQIDAWMDKWLIAQKSIDSKIEVFDELLQLFNGSNLPASAPGGDFPSPGLLSLLRQLLDTRVLPFRHRFPVQGVTYSSFKDLLEAASAASLAQTKFTDAARGDLLGLQELTAKLAVLERSALATGDPQVTQTLLAKLNEANQLAAHLASLKIQKQQSKLLRNLNLLI